MRTLFTLLLAGICVSGAASQAAATPESRAGVLFLLIEPGARALVPTGIAIGIPFGFEAQIRPRSGLAIKHGITGLNSPGTIDADSRGEVGVILINHGTEPFLIERGMRIAQLVAAPVTRAQWREAEVLDATQRGASGFGSTGTGSLPAEPQTSEKD